MSIYIKDLVPDTVVEMECLLVKKELRPLKNGQANYLSAILRDKTGTVTAKIWPDNNPDELFKILQNEKPVRIKGESQMYNNTIQLILKEIENTNRQPEDFVNTVNNFGLLKVDFVDALNSIKDEDFKKLIGVIFTEPFTERFFLTPGAIMYHHSYPGGLMEHTLNVYSAVKNLARFYSDVDAELALTGALLHDIGKVEEIGFFDFTKEGVLLGHIILGISIIDKALREIRKESDFPAEKELLIKHIMAASHGKEEWGSIKKPKVIEATLVHHADSLDAEAAKFLEAEGEGVYVYSKSLKRKVYLKKGSLKLI